MASNALQPPQGSTFSSGVPLCLKSLILLKWTDENGVMQTFRLKDMVSAQWEEFGTLLGICLNQLTVWKKECPGDIAACWQRVMEHWITGQGSPDYPVTWEGLFTLLEDLGCQAIAQELRSAVLHLSKNKS